MLKVVGYKKTFAGGGRRQVMFNRGLEIFQERSGRVVTLKENISIKNNMNHLKYAAPNIS